MAWVRVRDKQSGAIRVISEGVAKSLRDRFEILTENAQQVDEVVNTESLEAQKPSAPNVVAAPASVAEVAADEPKDDELEKARKRYEELYGGKPHGRTRLETLLKLIAEKENAG